MPYGEIVHNRIMLEIFRGCTRGCRFCQAGMIYRPVRERSMERVIELAEKLDFGWIDEWYFSEEEDGCMDAMTCMDNFDLGKWMDYIGGVVYRQSDCR